MRRQRRAAPALVAVLLLATAGCSGGDEPAASPPPAGHDGSPSPGGTEGATPAAPAYQPCEGLSVERVSRALGSPLREDRGTAEVPRCALLPEQEGGAVLDANYLVFPAGLDAAWESMGAPEDGTTTEPRVPGADAARLVVGVEGGTLTVSGFVQNGDLVQLVNAVDPAPHDRRAVARAVRAMLAQLSAHAAESGLT